VTLVELESKNDSGVASSRFRKCRDPPFGSSENEDELPNSEISDDS
jgi:hypothetical protein